MIEKCNAGGERIWDLWIPLHYSRHLYNTKLFELFKILSRFTDFNILIVLPLQKFSYLDEALRTNVWHLLKITIKNEGKNRKIEISVIRKCNFPDSGTFFH